MSDDARLAAIRERWTITLQARDNDDDDVRAGVSVTNADVVYLLARIETLKRSRSEAIKAVDTAIYLANGNAWPSQIVKALDTAMTVLQAGQEA